MRSLILLALLLGGCGGTMLHKPTELDVERIRPQWPDASLGQLQNGRSLYLSRCSRCHRLYDPKDRSAESWKIQLAKMRVRAGISTSEERDILQYLVAMAERTPTSSKTDSP